MKKTMEHSKKLTTISCVIFIISIVSCVVLSVMDKDVSIAEWIVASSGANFGLTVSFYMNKAKQENMLKIYKSIITDKECVDNDKLAEIRSEIESSIKNDLIEAINKSIT